VFGLKYSLVVGITPKSGDAYQEEVAEQVKSIAASRAVYLDMRETG
jgi:hypothetical protein